MTPNNYGRIIAFLALLGLFTAGPAFAQIDFTGEWAPLYHSDSPERLPGPELAVEDPTYPMEPFVTSSNFKKEADGAKFNPTPCSAK
ncbi:MAG TPA: hypothetical protein VKY31_09015 [Terriglobia bacterium]|nr:hypothetical protein [Terriglobia bacterium]